MNYNYGAYKKDKKLPLQSKPSVDISELLFKDPEVVNALNNGYPISYKMASRIASLDGVFINNKSLTSFNEFQYFTSIKSLVALNIFTGCINLTEIILPPTIEYIDPDAFKGCSKLVNIHSSSFGIGYFKLGSTFKIY